MGSSASKGPCTDLSESEIKFIVNNIGPDLLPLARQLKLTPTEMAELTQGPECLKNKAYKMIQWWIQRGGVKATKRAMITELAKIDRNDMADELSSPNPELTLTDFTKFQRRVIEKYAHLSVPQPPGIKKIIPIDKIFIDQEMENTTNSKNSKEECKILQIQSLIQQIKGDVLRILVEGDPGFGKTTLTVKLATDWALGKEYISKQFHMVLLIPLREVEGQELQDVIVDVIKRAIRKPAVEREHLDDYLTKHKVLLILDGYDELSFEDRKRIRPILKKEDLDNTCILVTSRSGLFTIAETAVHSTSSLLFKDDNMEYDSWDSRVFLKGLSPQQRTEVLENNFEIDSQTLNKMIELFKEYADELFRCPLLVFWLGWMLEKKGLQDIQTKTAFYRDLVNLILHKTLVREKKIDDNSIVDVFSHHMNDLQTDICQIGKLAIQRMISNNVLFKQSDLKFLENSSLLKSDLFLRYKSLTKNEEETYYQPMHKSFLEFLAAYSVCNSTTKQINFKEFKQNIANLVKQGLSPSRESLFYPFIAGLMGKKSHWLFRALLPWSSLNHIGKPEMMNLFCELNHIDDELMQILHSFIPCYYEMIPFKGVMHSYFSCHFHKRLLESAAENQLISGMDWRININPFPISSITLHTLRLLPQATSSQISVAKTSIHCKNLIYNINKNMDCSSWEQYLAVSKTITADQLELFLDECNSYTCSLILSDYVMRSKIKLHRIRTVNCHIDVFHLNTIIQLVKDNRITTGICIQLNKNHHLTADSVSKLWETVLQSTLITEFSFSNTNTNFIPVFQFKLPVYKKVFHLLHFNDYFRIEYNESFGKIDSIQELTLFNEVDKDVEVKNVLTNFSDVKYFRCYDRLFFCCFSNKLPFLSKISELYLHIGKEFSLDSTSSVMDVMPSLRTLILNVENLTDELPTTLEKFLVSALNGVNGTLFTNPRKLKVVGFHFIASADAFTFLVNCLTKVVNSIELDCLQIIFDESMKLSSNKICALENLLKSWQLKRLSIIDWFEANSSITTLLPCWFSEEEFQFGHQLHGNNDNHSMWNRQRFQHYMNCRNVYYVEHYCKVF